MSNQTDLAQAVREEREAEKHLEACRRRVNELVGLAPETSQRKKKGSRPQDFAKACGL